MRTLHTTESSAPGEVATQQKISVKQSASLSSYLTLLRPHQWHKNGFVLLGFFVLGDYGNFGLLARALVSMVAFCLASSAVYVFNDFRDREADRHHPLKKHRPLAAGTVHPATALVLATLAFGVSMILAFHTGGLTLLIIGTYVANNLVYSLYSRQIPIVDIFQVAFGFMLRIFAGTVGIGIYISEWMVITGFMLSLFIGFGKRYAELANHHDPQGQRQVLDRYSVEILRIFMNIMAAATIITYALYTLSPRSLELHGTTKLVYTTPIVVFAIFRVLYLIIVEKTGEDPASLVLRDRQLLIAVAIWMVSYGVVVG